MGSFSVSGNPPPKGGSPLKIYKFRVPFSQENLGVGIKGLVAFLSCDFQEHHEGETIMVWALVDPTSTEEIKEYDIRVVVTGESLPGNFVSKYRHLGTCISGLAEKFVAHVFIRNEYPVLR